MFFSSIEADYTKMGYPKAIVRALDFLKNTDVKSLPVGSKNLLQCGRSDDKGFLRNKTRIPQGLY